MAWIRAFHIVFVVTWFAGLFYLPRLFVYHATTQDEAGHERFKTMERRLFVMMTIGASLTTLFGVWMLAAMPALLGMLWIQIKLVLVVILLGYHAWCYRLLIDFRCGENRRSDRWYRGFNEVPSVLLVAIVLLAVVKPF